MTPEKLVLSTDKLVRLHQSKGIGLLAVDEAHCASQWGHDFRPEYRRIGEFRNVPALTGIAIMALTATATPAIRRDILGSLRMNTACRVFSNSSDRPNLALSVEPLRPGGFASNLAFLLEACKSGFKGSTIIYTNTTNNVDSLVAFLASALPPHCLVSGYHGKMNLTDRRTSHSRFLTSQSQIIVATVAFGMGIDKGDIRRIINYFSPNSIEQFYQMIGRGGRDGKVKSQNMI
jgi:RecQ family ATP-dependent DNA helicase